MGKQRFIKTVKALTQRAAGRPYLRSNREGPQNKATVIARSVERGEGDVAISGLAAKKPERQASRSLSAKAGRRPLAAAEDAEDGEKKLNHWKFVIPGEDPESILSLNKGLRK